MTQLIVTPIDMTAPGSYRQRKQFLQVARRLTNLKSGDSTQTLDAMMEMEALILAHLRTDDGTPVEDVLDELSAKQFDDLLSAITFSEGDSVPPENPAS